MRCYFGFGISRAVVVAAAAVAVVVEMWAQGQLDVWKIDMRTSKLMVTGIFRHTGPKNCPYANSRVDPDPYLKYLKVGPGLGLGFVQQ